MTTSNIDFNWDELEKQSNIKIIDKEELEATISLFKCPFRKYNNDNEFKPCLERNCMAFRADDKTFWCAMIEAYGRTPINSKHPIEMLHIGDQDW